MRRYLRDLLEGAKLMPALIRKTLNPDTWIEIMDDWTSRARENTGQEPDWKVERRRAKRRAARDNPPESE